MSIDSLHISKSLRQEGKRLGRAGLSARAHELVAAYFKNHPDGDWREAIILAGKLRAISLAAHFDSYWSEKTDTGFFDEAEYGLPNATKPKECES